MNSEDMVEIFEKMDESGCELVEVELTAKGDFVLKEEIIKGKSNGNHRLF